MLAPLENIKVTECEDTLFWARATADAEGTFFTSFFTLLLLGARLLLFAAPAFVPASAPSHSPDSTSPALSSSPERWYELSDLLERRRSEWSAIA